MTTKKRLQRKITLRYLPKRLTAKDRKKQASMLLRSRKLYKKGQYYTRPKIASFPNKKSHHLANAYNIYGVNNMKPTRKLANATKCNIKTLKKIMNKGEGAYFSSGSRPSQTAQSWGYARLASALTGGNASIVDFHLLNEGCQTNSLALKLAKLVRRRSRLRS